MSILEKSKQHEELIGNAAFCTKSLESNMDNHATHIGIFPSDQIFFFDQRSIVARTHPKLKSQYSHSMERFQYRLILGYCARRENLS